METIVKADIFFFITTISVILLTIFILIGIIYVLATVSKANKLLDMLTKEVTGTNAYIQDMLTDIRMSKVFTLFFHRSKKASQKRHGTES
ncbi:hypothetical protein IPF86_02605 [Candidatus Nomurabacteria bacterium]|jgi:hypothetical protein|nr:MAG: hypothetical protein IPF86_02605 [Candidatus Nomurabacteria bacterium]